MVLSMPPDSAGSRLLWLSPGSRAVIGWPSPKRQALDRVRWLAEAGVLAQPVARRWPACQTARQMLCPLARRGQWAARMVEAGRAARVEVGRRAASWEQARSPLGAAGQEACPVAALNPRAAEAGRAAAALLGVRSSARWGRCQMGRCAVRAAPAVAFDGTGQAHLHPFFHTYCHAGDERRLLSVSSTKKRRSSPNSSMLLL